MAYVLCAFILILCLAAPAVAGKKRSSLKRKPAHKKRYPVAENSLVKEMLRHLGVQYRRGGSGPGGVDCSGYVGLVYRNACGLTLPHQSRSLYSSSDLQKVSLDELKTGDLLFFTSSKKSRRVNHVGIYLSEGKFVHAATRKGVIVSSLDKQYYSERIAGARRVLEEEQLGNGDEDSSLGTLLDYRGNGADLSMMGHSLGLELGENRDFEISLFQDSLFSRKETRMEYFSTGLEGGAFSAHAQGIRFEKDIRPFPWLVVTPSLSYFDYHGNRDEAGLPRRSVGLDLSLCSEKDAWRISTGFRYLSLNSRKGYALEEHAPTAVDMSLTYSRRVSGGLSVSLIGERLQRYEPLEIRSAQQERGFDDQRFSIIFNLSY